MLRSVRTTSRKQDEALGQLFHRQPVLYTFGKQIRNLTRASVQDDGYSMYMYKRGRRRRHHCTSKMCVFLACLSILQVITLWLDGFNIEVWCSSCRLPIARSSRSENNVPDGHLGAFHWSKSLVLASLDLALRCDSTSSFSARAPAWLHEKQVASMVQIHVMTNIHG